MMYIPNDDTQNSPLRHFTTLGTNNKLSIAHSLSLALTNPFNQKSSSPQPSGLNSDIGRGTNQTKAFNENNRLPVYLWKVYN